MSDKSVDQLHKEFNDCVEPQFKEFLKMPMIQLMMSLIPPTEPPELLVTLLRSAFEAGQAGSLAALAKTVFNNKNQGG